MHVLHPMLFECACKCVHLPAYDSVKLHHCSPFSLSGICLPPPRSKALCFLTCTSNATHSTFIVTYDFLQAQIHVIWGGGGFHPRSLRRFPVLIGSVFTEH